MASSELDGLEQSATKSHLLECDNCNSTLGPHCRMNFGISVFTRLSQTRVK